MNTLALPWWMELVNHPLLSWIFATTEDESSDQGGFAAEDDSVDFDAEFDEESSEESDEEEDSKDEPEEDKSLVEQKKHWRNKANSLKSDLEKAKAELERLKGAKDGVSDEQKQAKTFIQTALEELLKEREAEKRHSELEAEAALNEELEKVLEDNKGLKESDILETIEEYGVTPTQAARILKRGKTEVKKPVIPKPKRAQTEIKKTEEKAPTSIDEAIARAKKLLRSR